MFQNTEKPNQPAEGAAQEAGDKSKADLRRERKAIQVFFYNSFIANFDLKFCN